MNPHKHTEKNTCAMSLVMREWPFLHMRKSAAPDQSDLKLHYPHYARRTFFAQSATNLTSSAQDQPAIQK